MKTTLIACGILTLLLVLFRPRRIIDPPLPASPEDRQFLANEIEHLVRLPLTNQQELEAWYRACNLIQDRIEVRFGSAASVLPSVMFHYFSDADIRLKDASYRQDQDKTASAFIHRLRI